MSHWSYLGTLLTDKTENHAEINNRISDCIITANKLKLFWDKAETTKQWKLRVYDAIIRSNLQNGLETTQLTQVEQKRLNTFQMKGIRRLMNIPPTFEDRSWTNDRVSEEASIALGKPIRLFSEVWQSAKFKLLGHILRTAEGDPMREVVVAQGTWCPRTVPYRRRGARRKQWIAETMYEAFDEVFDNEWVRYDFENEEHNDIILEAAKERAGIFSQKLRRNRQICINMSNFPKAITTLTLSQLWQLQEPQVTLPFLLVWVN